MNYLSIIATVLATGGTVLKALELSSSYPEADSSKRSRRALLAARDGIDPKWAMAFYLWGMPADGRAHPSSAGAVYSDPQQLLERWRCDARSAISMVDDIFSIFTAFSAIVPVIMSIAISVLGGSDACLLFAILPFQIAIFAVISWWIKGTTIPLN